MKESALFLLALGLASVGLSADQHGGLSRDYGCLHLGMTTSEFRAATGLSVGGKCASCSPGQSLVSMPTQSVRSMANILGRGLGPTDDVSVYFIQGKLEMLTFTVEGRPRDALLAMTRQLGRPARSWHFSAIGTCPAQQHYLWRDHATEVLLIAGGAAGDEVLEVTVSDRALVKGDKGQAPGAPAEC